MLLHVHEIHFEFPPNPRFRTGVTTYAPNYLCPLDVIIEGSSRPPRPGHLYSTHDFDVFRSDVRLLPHDIGVFVQYDRYNKLLISFDGRPGAGKVPELTILAKDDSSFYWKLLQHDTALREAYRKAVHAMVNCHRDEILGIIASDETADRSEDVRKAVDRPWAWGQAPEANIRRIQEIASEGIIPASALPIPKLRNFLNQEISCTVREVSTWKPY